MTAALTSVNAAGELFQLATHAKHISVIFWPLGNDREDFLAQYGPPASPEAGNARLPDFQAQCVAISAALGRLSLELVRTCSQLAAAPGSRQRKGLTQRTVP
jgi:hypothetical protein